MIDKRTTNKGEPRYEVRLRGPDGKERSRTFRTRKEAERYEREQRSALDRGQWVDPRDAATTVDAWAAHWLASDLSKRDRTKSIDEGIIRRHLSPILGSRSLGSVTPLDVQRLVGSWATSQAARTVRRRYAVLSAVFASAVAADLLLRSPCRGVKLPSIESRARRALCREDLDRIAAEVPSEYRCLVFLGAVTGLRFSELAGLQVRNVDLLRGTLTVVRTVGENRGKLFVDAPKTQASRRTIAISAAVADLIAAHLASRRVTAADADAPIFVGRGGGLLRYSHFRQRVWAPACDRAGLKGTGFHDLRRAAATALVRSGVDVKTAQHRLGHADVRVTIGLYAQVSQQADRDAADRLDEAFLGLARAERPAMG